MILLTSFVAAIVLLWGTALYAREVVSLEPGRSVGWKYALFCIVIVTIAFLIFALGL